MIGRAGLHQLGRDAHLVPGLEHAALQHIAHSQRLADFADVYGLALVGEDGVAGDDKQVRDLGEIRNEHLGHAIAEIVLGWVPTQIGEGQHGNGGFVGQCQPGGFVGEVAWPDGHHPYEDEEQSQQCQGALPPGQRQDAAGCAPLLGPDASSPYGSHLFLLTHRGGSGPGLQPHPIHPHRLGDVLDRLRAQVFIPQSQPGLDLVIHGPGDAEAPCLGQALEARRDVDPIPIDPFSLGNDIPQVDANAKFHATVREQLSISGFEFALDSDGALHGLHHTGKLRQQVIARGVHDPPPVLLDEASHHLPIGGDGTDGRHLVFAHEAAIPLDIGAEDRRKPAFHAHTLPVLMVACLTDLEGASRQREWKNGVTT